MLPSLGMPVQAMQKILLLNFDYEASIVGSLGMYEDLPSYPIKGGTDYVYKPYKLCRHGIITDCQKLSSYLSVCPNVSA